MDKPKISIVVAIDDKRGIGKDNKLLFKISEDLRRFKQLTKGHAVIMGRKTFDSIIGYNGKPLPGRLNVVLTHSVPKQQSGFEKDENSPLIFTTDFSQAMQLGEEWESKYPEKEREIFIIGGAQIFAKVLEEDLVDRIYLTQVKGEYDADTFFPDCSAFTDIIEKEEKESEGYQYTFLTLEK